LAILESMHVQVYSYHLNTKIIRCYNTDIVNMFHRTLAASDSSARPLCCQAGACCVWKLCLCWAPL